MKKITLLAAITLALAACNNSYNISGTTSGDAEGKTAYLINQNNEAIDSCLVADSSFTFKGNISEPDIYRIQIERRSNIVFVEPGSTANIDYKQTSLPVTDNGGANDKKNDFMQSLNTFITERQSRYEKMLQAGTPQEEIIAFSQKTGEEMKEIYKKCITDNKDNIFGAYMLANIARNFYDNLISLDSVIAAVKYSHKIGEIQNVRNALKYKEATKEGCPFVDFKGKDINGEEISLSAFVGKGKYVLIDFWASWCGPCRGEIPNLLAVNKEFGGDNFEVVGINVWDQEQKFKESLVKEGIDYAQIYVPSNVNATELYGINGIPQIMLIGPDGTILKRDLRGEDIRKAVTQALGK